jgi:hypothetical protein
MGHPDFRIQGKIFATLACDQTWGMVKLTPEQQKTFVAAKPKIFQPLSGAWGRSGCTKVDLAAGTKTAVAAALAAAWENIAPKSLLKKLGDK